MTTPRQLRRALVRAGAFGAAYGGTGGPELGVTVPVDDAAQVLATLGTAADAGVRVTLLVPAGAAAWGDALRAATAAGHEIAGRGPLRAVRDVAALDVAAGQALRHWDVTPTGAGAGVALRHVRALAARGVHALPVPGADARPGGTVRVPPATLAGTLADVRARGYRPVPVRDLPGLRRAAPRDALVHAYGRTVEANFTRAHGVIDLTARADAVMRVAPLDHAPAPLPLPRHTPTAELHLDSARLVSLAARSQLGTYRAYQRSLGDVAAALRGREELAGARAVFAVTLFYGPLAQAGFTLLDLPPARARAYGMGFRVLRLVHGTVRPPSVREPRMAWMPRDEFLRRFG